MPDLNVQQTSGWPANVPSNDVALAIVSQRSKAGQYSATTDVVLAALSPLERGCLVDGAESPTLALIREAVVLRWRIAVAITLRPPIEAPIDIAARDALLADIDVVLERLRLAPRVDLDSRQALDMAMKTLAHDAVLFTQIIAEARRVLATGRARTARDRYEYLTSQVTRGGAEQAEKRRKVRTRLLIAGAVVSLFVTGFTHDWWRRPELGIVTPIVVPGAPEGVEVTGGERGGITLFRVGETLSPQAMERISAEAQTGGRELIMLSPRDFLIVPETSREDR